MKWKSPKCIITFENCSGKFHTVLKAFVAAPTSTVMFVYGILAAVVRPCK